MKIIIVKYKKYKWNKYIIPIKPKIKELERVFEKIEKQINPKVVNLL